MNRPGPGRPSLFLLVLAFVGFISLGLPDAIIGVAWPSVRETFHLRQGMVGLVLLCSGVGYLLSSFLSGRLMSAVGIGLLLAGSTGLVAASMFGFGFAPIWILFLCCACVHGLGSGAIDSGLNGYAAHHMSTRQMIWLHACYCFGALIGPILMSSIVSSGRHYSLGYSIVGGTMLTLAVVFFFARNLWGATSAADAEVHVPIGMGTALRSPAVWLQMATFFLYTGLEVTLSQWTFTVLTESRHISPRVAGAAVGVYWGCIGVGRVLSGLIADRFGIDRLVRICLLAAASGAVLFAIPLPAWAAFAGLSLAGLGLAPVFPCLMTRTPQRLGPQLSAHAVGFQVGAAMIGAAAVPGTLGILAGRVSLEAVPTGAAILFGVLVLLHEILVRRPDAEGAVNEAQKTS
jgi:fucose permease